MKYALSIGNNKYDDPKLAQLKTPAADSQALAKVLDDKTIGGFDAVTPLINQNETRVRRAISEFLTDKKPDDLVMLYFSGHGILDDRGRLYLALKDTQVNLLKATSLPSSFLTDEMDSCRSKRQILILDCCHSGAFARGVKGEQKAVTEATFEGSGFGRVVLTASDSTQYALEGDQVAPLRRPRVPATEVTALGDGSLDRRDGDPGSGLWVLALRQRCLHVGDGEGPDRIRRQEPLADRSW